MARKIYARTDYQEGSALRLPRGSADPSTNLVEGDVFWREDTAIARVYDGSSFADIDPGIHGQAYNHTQGSSSASWSVAHSLGTTSVDVYVYDVSDNLIIPDDVSITDSNNLVITLNTAQTGRAVVFGFNTGLSLTTLRNPSGHDVTRLEALGYPVRSHWLMDDSIVNGTSVPDAKGNHDGTADTTIEFSGRPRIRGLAFAEDQVWVHTRVALSGSIYPLMVDANWSIWGWIWVERSTESAHRTLIACNLAGETSPTNVVGQLGFNSLDDYGVTLHLVWEYGAGVNVDPGSPRIVPGMHHIVYAVEHDTPSVGSSTARVWLDGEPVTLSPGYGTSPSDGSSGIGYLVGHPSVSGENSGLMVTDVVLMSGPNAVPRTRDVVEQYRRGLGIY